MFRSVPSWRWRGASAIDERGSVARSTLPWPNTTWARVAWRRSCLRISTAQSRSRVSPARCGIPAFPTKSSSGATRRISVQRFTRCSTTSTASITPLLITSGCGRRCGCSRCIGNHHLSMRAPRRHIRAGRTGNGHSSARPTQRHCRYAASASCSRRWDIGSCGCPTSHPSSVCVRVPEIDR